MFDSFKFMPGSGSTIQQFPPQTRIFSLKIALSCALLSELLLAPGLWISSRSYPMIPVAGFLPTIPFPWDYVLFGLLILILVLICFCARPQKLMVALVGLCVLLALWDQSRWQPWFYQYVLMFATLSFYSWKPASSPEGSSVERESELILNVCRIVIASLYLWSGIQKVNATFVMEVFPTLVHPFARLLPPHLQTVISSLGFLAPLVEATIGIGLLTRRYRQLFVYIALAMHAFVLMALVSLRLNLIVWPWNLAMMAFVVILFHRFDNLSLREVMSLGKLTGSRGERAWGSRLFFNLVIVLFGVMPIFSFFGLWDSYFSANLYSGRTVTAEIQITDSVLRRLPPEIREHIRLRNDGKIIIDPNRWSFRELHVPAVPEERVYKLIGKRICTYAENPTAAVLTISGKPGLLNRVVATKQFDCASLGYLFDTSN